MTLRLVKKKIKAVYIGTPYTPRLPAEYQEVERIQSTGGQYIDLSYKPKDTTRMQFKYVYTNYTGYVFIGSIGNSDNDDWRFFRAGNVTYFDMGSGRINGSYVTSTTDEYETEIGNYYVKNLKTGTNILTGTTQGSYTKSYNIRIFTQNQDYGIIYYLKIYEGDSLVQDLVPCYRKSDNVIGLYDLVNNQFYTNSGTGTFTKGQNVGRPYVQIRPSDPATIILNAINNNDTSALNDISANAEMMKVLISNTDLTTAFIAKNDLLQQFVNTMWNTVSSSNLFTLVGNGSGDDSWGTQQTWAATANSITFFSGGYYSSASNSGLMYHRGGALAKQGNKGGRRPGSVNTNNVEGVSFVGATFGQSGDGYVASATYKVT